MSPYAIPKASYTKLTIKTLHLLDVQIDFLKILQQQQQQQVA